MKVVTFRLTLHEPVLVTSLDGDPNSAVSYDFLPGSVLRGAIIAKYLQHNKASELNVTHAQERRLFFDVTTRYLNGYLVDRLNRRMLPTPLSWHHEKGDETLLYDFAVEPPDTDDPRQWDPVRSPWCTLTDEYDDEQGYLKVRLLTTERLLTVHTARDRHFGRPRDDAGAVYRYDALAAGQTFEAAILCDHDEDTAHLLPLLQGEATLGGSRSGGYGRVSFHDVKEITGSWREVGGSLDTTNTNVMLAVTLLSNTMLRDANGQCVVDSYTFTRELSVCLGGVQLRLHTDKTFLEERAIGGFNRKWGLPLPQALAIRMGGVLVYDMPSCDKRLLQNLEDKGIGERRSEGFGRIAVNWQGEEDQFTVEISPRPELTEPIPITDATGQTLARRMVQRLLRQRLDELTMARANTVDIDDKHHQPSNAQLSQLRQTIHNALILKPPDAQRVRTFLAEVRQRPSIRARFAQAYVDHKRLWYWLSEALYATSHEQWVRVLGFQADDLRRIGGMEPEMTEGLRTEYVLRLMDAVLAHMLQKRRT